MRTKFKSTAGATIVFLLLCAAAVADAPWRQVWTGESDRQGKATYFDFSHDGKKLAWQSDQHQARRREDLDKAFVEISILDDVTSDDPPRTIRLQRQMSGHSRFLFSPDDAFLVFGLSGRLCLVRVADGEITGEPDFARQLERRNPHGGIGAKPLAYSGDGRRLLVKFGVNQLATINVGQSEIIKTYTTTVANQKQSFSHDGRYLTLCTTKGGKGRNRSGALGEVRVIDTRNSRAVAELTGFPSTALAWLSPEADRLITWTRNSWQQWALRPGAGAVNTAVRKYATLVALSASADLRRIAVHVLPTNVTPARIEIWDAYNSTREFDVPFAIPDQRLGSIELSPAGNYLAARGTNTRAGRTFVYLCDLEKARDANLPAATD